MIRRDYFMDIIREIIRTIFKILFNIDTNSPDDEILDETNEKIIVNGLRNMIDNGDIVSAESEVTKIAENKNVNDLKIILIFYSYLNEKSDDFFEINGYSRMELKENFEKIVRNFGFGNIFDLFIR